MSSKKIVFALLGINLAFTMLIGIFGFDLRPIFRNPSLLITHTNYLVLDILLGVLVINLFLGIVQILMDRKKNPVAPIVKEDVKEPVVYKEVSIEKKTIDLSQFEEEVTTKVVVAPKVATSQAKQEKLPVYLNPLEEDKADPRFEVGSAPDPEPMEEGLEKVETHETVETKIEQPKKDSYYAGIDDMLAGIDEDEGIVKKIIEANAIQKTMVEVLEQAEGAVYELTSGEKKPRKKGKFKELRIPLDQLDE